MSTDQSKDQDGINWDSRSRTAADLSAETGRETSDNIWSRVQRGLAYPSPYAIFATFFRRRDYVSEMTKYRLGHILANARHMIHEVYPKAHTSLILGVGFDLWHEMSDADRTPLPVGMQLQFPMDGEAEGRPSLHSSVFHRQGTAFTDSNADLWFHINIREDFPVEALEEALRAFANGAGASIMTITCADPDTYQRAMRDPEKYDLLRVRMGGWSEFFVTMFPAHQAQHQRRPLETASSTPEGGTAHA